MFCPNCGTSIENPGKFCPSCGEPLPPRSTRLPEPEVEAPPSQPIPAVDPSTPPESEVAPAEPVELAAPPWGQTPPQPVAPAEPPAAEPEVPAIPVWAPAPPPAIASAPPWGQTPPPAALPVPPAAPPWAQQPLTTPLAPAQPPYGAAPYHAPPPAYGAPPAPFRAATYGAPPVPYGTPAATPPASASNPLAGLLALIGGAVAVGSAWLPWYMASSDPMQTAAWGRPIDLTKELATLANGYYLIGAGALAAVCGLLLIIGAGRSPGARMLLGLGALAGAVGVGAIEFSAYGKVNDNGLTYGFGLFVGVGAAVFAGLGGLVGLTSRPAPAGSKAGSSQGLATVLALVLVAAVAVGGGAYFLAQNNKSSGPGASGSLRPSGASEQPSTSPSTGPTATPGSSPSFLTAGYSTREEAIGDYVVQHSVTYAGDCDTPGPGDYCSILDSKVSDNEVVYKVGPVASEPVAWLLLRQTDDGLWHVLDQKPFSDSATSPWQ